MKKVLIVGAGIAGRDVSEEINRDKSLGMKIVGFIDDDPEKIDLKIASKKVLGSSKDLKNIIVRKKINEIIIAIPSARGEQINNYVKLCSEARVNFRIVPRVKEIIEGKAHVKAIRSVMVEDLLGRPVIKADIPDLKKFFKGKKVLITGAAGSIGSELSRQIAAYNPESLILFDWWENGIFEIKNDLDNSFPQNNIVFIIGSMQDLQKVKSVMSKYKPNYIFHAAAYKHVPLMEENPEEAIKNNISGTWNFAKEAKKMGVEKFIIISTDKAANPVNVMGATKLITEAIGKMLNDKTKFMSVRFGNVLGSNSSVIPIFESQIEKGGPVKITDKRMTRYFMTISESVQLILKAGYIGKGGELFVLDMGKPIKIVDLAENLIRLSGYIPGKDIEIVYSGLRKGEKLHEELFTEKELLTKTQEEKIFVTKSSGININNLFQTIEKLKSLAEEGEQLEIRKEFNKIIKSFPIMRQNK